MWFIFPQLAGLGHSPMAQRFAIRDLDQAARYLVHPLLGSRRRHDVRLMTSHKGNKSALEILGTPDDLKFRSCLTLFAFAKLSPRPENRRPAHAANRAKRPARRRLER
jgi:uncharacterized protein (DUF1810 family)